jgi:hypothetical protein
LRTLLHPHFQERTNRLVAFSKQGDQPAFHPTRRFIAWDRVTEIVRCLSVCIYAAGRR